MNKGTRVLGLAVCLATMQSALHAETFHDVMCSMREEMNRVFSDLDAMFSKKCTTPDCMEMESMMPAVSITETDRCVCLTVTTRNVDCDCIKADCVKDKKGCRLMVEIPQPEQKMVMEVGTNYMNCMVMCEKTEDKKCDASSCNSEPCCTMGSCQMVRSLPCSVCCENPEINYCKEKQELTINLPKVCPTERESVKINVKK